MSQKLKESLESLTKKQATNNWIYYPICARGSYELVKQIEAGVDPNELGTLSIYGLLVSVKKLSSLIYIPDSIVRHYDLSKEKRSKASAQYDGIPLFCIDYMNVLRPSELSEEDHDIASRVFYDLTDEQILASLVNDESYREDAKYIMKKMAGICKRNSLKEFEDSKDEFYLTAAQLCDLYLAEMS
ncbi:hypothetical protein HOK51_02200 [Candidatus Woesearchaeota archaeon]|jgi:hypothetical protein|nr:hypothetical protein [Candidatus Woesearchaeota archaeon]MBT6518628.1 hypothetical protein [Candidatus Woesearchaeota archaeon]MBT7368047.1 hypothetical protein [Candidatus Woesearchaeota archaeon]